MANWDGGINWRRIGAFTAAVLLALTLGACKGKDAEESSEPEVSTVTNGTVFPEGTEIGGINIGGKTKEEALEIAKGAMEEAVNGLEITVTFKDDTVLLKDGDFTIKDVLELSLPDMLESGKAEKYELPFVADLSPEGESKLTEAAKT